MYVGLKSRQINIQLQESGISKFSRRVDPNHIESLYKGASPSKTLNSSQSYKRYDYQKELFRGRSPKKIIEKKSKKSDLKDNSFSSKKFSRFLIKNNDWSQNLESQKRKLFFGRKQEEIIGSKAHVKKEPKNKSSFVSLDYIKEIVGEKCEIKHDHKTDFYKKDFIHQHPSIFELRGVHFLTERYCLGFEFYVMYLLN